MAVTVGEEEEVPLKVHTTVFDTIHQVQLLQVDQASHQVTQLVVVCGGFLCLSLTARLGLVPKPGWGRELHGWQELIHMDPVHVALAEGQQVENHSGVRGAGDKVLQQVLQVSLKEHSLPAASVPGHVAHGPALRAAAAPIALILDQVGSHGQWQVGGQVAQDFLLVLWEQLLQDRVVFRSRGRKTEASHSVGDTITWFSGLGLPG